MTLSRPGPRPRPKPPRPPPVARRYPQTANSGSAMKVTFCVRGVLSPLLSNLVLDELDRELDRRGHRFVRYADDCNIYVRSEKAGRGGMASLTRFIEGRLKLQVNAEKSAVARPWQRSFLGFTVKDDDPLFRRCIADKAVARFKRRVRAYRAAPGRQPGTDDRRASPVP